MQRFLLIACCATASMLADPVLAGGGEASGDAILSAQLITGTPQEKLAKLLRPHAYYGGRITDDIRAATGDPNITVIDRRFEWGEIYTCNYIYLQGNRRGRALVCE